MALAQRFCHHVTNMVPTQHTCTARRQTSTAGTNAGTPPRRRPVNQPSMIHNARARLDSFGRIDIDTQPPGREVA